jgi:hypothetical protein
VRRTNAGVISSAELTLDHNYPNPFNSTTSIRFVVDQNQHVELSIYNAPAHLVRTLVSGEMARWNHNGTRKGRLGIEIAVQGKMYALPLSHD